jgi:putative ABC transport system substrate-binding protein
MKRREFISLLGGAAAAPSLLWPLAARAQQGERMRRVGVLTPHPASNAESQAGVRSFRQELQKLGWTDGGNLRIDERWTGGDEGRLRDFAKELVSLQPDVILVRSTPATTLLRQESRTIPIVFVVVSDPVGDGFVASMSRPGGNVTGFTNVEASLAGKWLELLKEIAPGTGRVGVLFGPKTSPGGGGYYLRLIEDAATSMAVKSVASPLQDVAEIDQVIATFVQAPNGGFVVTPDVMTTAHHKLLVETIARHRVPAVYWQRFFVASGGLISYGTEIVDQYRRAAGYIDRILKGEKPADLPVQAPVKYELVINLKTVKALGLDVPPTLLARADEVIE